MALIGEMQYLTIGGNTYSLPVGGGGTVTSVAVSNATNGGLSVSGSPISSSGTITIGHSNVLSSAQTTQAVYPIKIDKNGHISAYGSAVTIPTVNNATLTIQKNGTTVNSFTANASSNVTANITVPTKTSDLTNDSGFITGYTDEKVYVTGNIDSGTIYYPILATGSGTATRQIDYYGALKYKSTAGGSGADGTAVLELGNNIASGTADNEYGVLRLYGTTTKYYDLKTYPGYPAANRTIYFPRYANTMHLTCTSGTSAVGGATTKPVYVDDTGCIQEVTSIPYSLLTGTPTISYPVTSVNTKTGAVSLTASDVGALASNTTYVSTITTTAGTHSAISSSTGAVSFNVPTKTSHLTNDSGFITASHTSTYSLPLAADGTRGGVQIGYSESGTNYAVKLSSEKMYVTVPWTDTKVTTAALKSGTTYYPILATGTGTATRQIDSTLSGLKYVSTAGTTSAVGTAILCLGNTTGSGTANNEQGVLRLYSSNATYYTDLKSSSASSIKTITFPNKTGTVALTSDIPTATSTPTVSTIAKFDSTAHMNSEDMTTQEVDDFVDGLNVSGSGILDMFYPVGSIYQTVDDGFNPNIRWGGTWELIEEGRFLQATETSATGGDTVSAGLPNIGGYLNIRATDYDTSPMAWADGVFIQSTTAGFQADGVHQQNGAVDVLRYNFDAHYYNSIYGNSTTVQPPAIKVYMWHRTA